MTLQQFLFNNGRVDLNVETTIKAHIRQYVQNIDVLASKDLRDITHDEIRNTYMANHLILILEGYSGVTMH